MREKRLFTGNEALARGAYESGVVFAAGYPGTPSTEILEALVHYPNVHAQWSPNEKTACEAAVAAAIGGARALVTMKHVGLNVAADAFVNSSYTGCAGGLVVIVADDPGIYSSQNEQDSRHYARLAKVPVLEPGNAREAYQFVLDAFALSERFHTPVLIRTTTAVAHARGVLDIDPDFVPERHTADFKRAIPHYALVPQHARARKKEILARLESLAQVYNTEEAFHTCIRRPNASVGIICTGAPALACMEIFDNASILKLAGSYPFADDRIRAFAQGLETLFVIEENDDFLEEHIRSLALPCRVCGTPYVPKTGELSPTVLRRVRRYFEQGTPPPEEVNSAADLPPRPPVLCPGCPHRGTFLAIKRAGVLALGDIGCYSLGVLPPLSALDIILCMGGGASMPHGLLSAGETKKTVGVLGDSTFFHSGITGLIDAVYNKSSATIIVLDNRITAMTGHQDHPGTGRTLAERETIALSIEKMAEACGVKRIRVINPYDVQTSARVIEEEAAADEVSLIVARAPCPLHAKKAVGVRCVIDANVCKNCRACLKIGCPAVQVCGSEKPSIDPNLCAGCDLCLQACAFNAITHEK